MFFKYKLHNFNPFWIMYFNPSKYSMWTILVPPFTFCPNVNGNANIISTMKFYNWHFFSSFSLNRCYSITNQSWHTTGRTTQASTIAPFNSQTSITAVSRRQMQWCKVTIVGQLSFSEVGTVKLWLKSTSSLQATSVS